MKRMPVEQPSRISQWIGAFREWLPTARQRGAEWVSVVREEPRVIWHTPAVRYGAYAVGGLVLVLTVRWAAGMLSPGGGTAQPPATTASFDVVCSNPACRHHYKIMRKFGYDDFPVECAKCKQMTGRRGVQCFAGKCNGRWVYAATVDGQTVCAVCRQPMPDAP